MAAYRHTYDDLLRVVEQIGFEPSEEVWREVWGVWQFGLGCTAPSWATCHRWRQRRHEIGRRVIEAHHRLIVANCAVDRACAAANMSRGQLARALRLVAKAEKAE